ncbi:MAG TPA: sulfatase-like hydrolase/transferase [archaeon]|nr:sulfatase-like hydrolase/transferase [archaeon]
MLSRRLYPLLTIFLVFASCSGSPRISKDFPNILLIVLDAARADHFSSYGYFRPTTPNLDRVASEGVLFTRAVSTSSWTLPAHASLFTGLVPDEHGTTNQHAWLIDRIPTLAELLKKRGYRTGCFTNNPHIDRVQNLVRGFDVLESVWADSTVITEAKHHNTEHTNVLVRSFVENGSGSPFFVFINYMDVHQPYDAPEPYRSMYLGLEQKITARIDSACRYFRFLNDGSIVLSKEENAAVRAVYDGCLTYLDAQVEVLLQALRRAGVYDNTLIIITSDHGEVFGEFGHYSHSKLLYRPLIHIPLVIRYPSIFPSPSVRDELVSIVDIFHSLVDLLGLQGAAKTGLPKHNLFSKTIKKAPCYSKFTIPRLPPEEMKHRYDTRSVWTPENRHYILRGDEAIECFDLTVDFAEQHNLCPPEVAPGEVISVISEVRETLVEFVENAQDLRVIDRVEVDPQQERAMRALGYVGGNRNLASLKTHAHPHVQAHIDAGTFFLGLDSLRDAESEFRKALFMNSAIPIAHHSLGIIFMKRGDYAEAITEFRSSFGLSRENEEGFESSTRMIIFRCLFSMGRIQEAIEEINKIDASRETIIPMVFKVLINLAEANEFQAMYDFLGRFEAENPAFRAYQEYPDYMYVLGTLLYKKGKYDEAAGFFRQAIEVKPDFVGAHLYLGGTYVALGFREKAVEQFNLVLELDPDNSNARNNLRLIKNK